MCNVETVCIDENFSDFWVCIPSKITHAVVVVVSQNMRGVPAWTACNPGYLEDRRILAEVEREKAVQCRGREYQREFQGLLGAYSFSNSHAVVVVVTQCMCGVPVWSGIRHTSITEGLWRKLTA